MTELRNRRHELFAIALAKGASASQAYIEAGYQPCRQNASRLASNDDIAQRVIELQSQRETDTKSGRDPATGQFVVGHRGHGGRPRGSRNLLGERFLADLYDEWEVSGVNALKRTAEMDPVQFVKITAGLLPHKIDQTINIDADLFREVRDFREAWRLARQFIGADSDGENGVGTGFSDLPLIEATANDDNE
jgi:hypothetical protein